MLNSTPLNEIPLWVGDDPKISLDIQDRQHKFLKIQNKTMEKLF